MNNENNQWNNAFDEETKAASPENEGMSEYTPVQPEEEARPAAEPTGYTAGPQAQQSNQAPQYRYQPPMSGQNGYGQQPPYQPYGYRPYPNGNDPWKMPEYPTPQPRKKKKGRTGKVILGIFASLMGLVILAFAGFGVYSFVNDMITLPGISIEQDKGPEEITPPADQPKAPDKDPAPSLQGSSKPFDNVQSPADGVLTTAQINEKVAPSVVGIIQYRTNNLQATGSGSGIILSANGYIATNAHVVDNADSLEVVLSDGTAYPGKVVGADHKTDLAVVKIEADGLIPAELGISGELTVGEKAVAIGNPGGMTYAGSVSEGIISGLNRSIRAADDGYTMNFIQTDAAISPGNSGGALVNEFGQVVGINSQKMAADGYEGIGLAIPVDEAMPILEDLMNYGRVRGRVKLGITAYELNEYVAAVNGVPSGILIDSVEKSSSLNAAGVQAGDIITEFEGTKVNSLLGLLDVMRDYKPGDQVTLTIFRARTATGGYRYNNGNRTIQGETFTVTVTLLEDTGMSLDIPYGAQN